MKSLLVIAAAASVAWTLGAPICAAEDTAPSASIGPATLTVTGAVGQPNRAAFDAFHDVFFAFHDRPFARARAFSYAALSAMPQTTVTANAEEWPQPVMARGPLLSVVLEEAGVPEGAMITVVALDGYAVLLDPAQRAEKEWVLAIEVDGAPLGIGGFGPVWLLHDTGEEQADDEMTINWVWSAFMIEAEEQSVDPTQGE